MCIIIVKPEGNTLSKETLEICFANNDDGAGFMWYNADTHLVVGDKGYMSFVTLWKGLEAKGFITNDEVNAERGLVLHCRIATHGGVQAPLTHPFPITQDERMLRMLNWEYAWGLCHNGTINGVTDWNNKTGESDTLAFVKNYLADEQILSLINHEPFIKLITFNLRASNKFAILTPDGDLVLVGNFIKGQDGNIYSNSSFQEKVTRYYNNRWGYQGYNSTRTVILRIAPTQGKVLEECTNAAVNCAVCSCYSHYPSNALAYAHYCSLYKKYMIPKATNTQIAAN